MRALFNRSAEACDNTLVIAQRCAFLPQSRRPILPAFPLPDDADEATALREAARAGLAARVAAPGSTPPIPHPIASASNSSST